MISICVLIACQQTTTVPRSIGAPGVQGGATSSLRKVAVLPWAMKDGVEEAEQVTRDALVKIFEKVNYEEIPEVRAKSVWENDLNYGPLKLAIEGDEAMPDLPAPERLLKLGQAMSVDLVCAGRAKFHSKSVWVSLGPKTKSDCTVDVILVDVANKQVILEAHDIKADDTKTESTLETAGALFVSMGITAFSGGPKTPHEKKAGVNAVLKALDPWIKTIGPGSRKIGG